MSLTAYPGALDTFTTKKNNIDLYDANHMNKVQDAVLALEETVGTNSDSSSSISSKARRVYTKIVSTDGSGDYQCDGIDDEVQIQAAIDAVEAAGGGVVYLRAGTYVTGIQLTVDTADVHVIGEGMGATIIQAKSGFQQLVAILALEADNCSVQNLTVDGNKANNSFDNYGIAISFSNTQRLNCFIRNCEAKNTNYNGSGGIGFFVGNGDYALLENCYSHDNEQYGFYINTNTTYAVMSHCYSKSNSQGGLSLIGDFCTVIGCKFVSDIGYGVIMSSSAIGCHVNANYIACTQGGILVNGSDNNVIQGNIIDGVNNDADNSYSGILLQSIALRNVISGNRILLSSGSNNFQYGIREGASTSDFNCIVGNIVNDGQTGVISTQGTSTVSASNVVT